MINVCLKSLFLSCCLALFGLAPLTADSSMDDCSKEVLLAYFPDAFINETLKKFNVPEDKWAKINADLQQKDKEIVILVEEKASKISPNPLKDPQQRQVAVNLFRDTLYEVFASVLKKYGIEDSAKLHAMLDDVQQQKAKRFAQCLQKKKSSSKQ